MMPKISVIMGVYNADDESVLKEAINSILNQTFKDFEYIICDDGSTNNTYEIIKKIINNDERVILIRNEENKGLAYTLNRCIELANGEYIARMDADDISKQDRLQKEYDFLKKHKEYAVVSCNIFLIDENGKIFGKRKYPEKINKKEFLHGNPVSHPAVMIRKDALNSVNNYRVSKETRRAEDYDLWMRMYAKGYKIYNIQENLLNFREDNKCLKRRKYKYRIDEVVVRYNGYKSLKLFPKGYIYMIKPLIV